MSPRIQMNIFKFCIKLSTTKYTKSCNNKYDVHFKNLKTVLKMLHSVIEINVLIMLRFLSLNILNGYQCILLKYNTAQ